MKKTLQRTYLILIAIFLYAPIGVLIVLSFNQSKSRAHWGGFSTKWYAALFQNKLIMDALQTTLILALLSSLIAVILGTAAAMGMEAMGKKMQALTMGITNIPLLNADIVTGISMMLLFIALNMKLSFGSVLIAHITFNIPYVILSVTPRIRRLDPCVYEAARDLGAAPARAFRKVVMPELMPGILSGFLLAFTMSLDDFIITHFTKGPGFDTLSTRIYTEVKKGIKPEMYALSTILFVSVFVLLLLLNGISSRKTEKKAAHTGR